MRMPCTNLLRVVSAIARRFFATNCVEYTPKRVQRERARLQVRAMQKCRSGCYNPFAGGQTGNQRMNWDDLRVVLAVHRAGSMSRAARVLDVDQSTATRRLAAIERDLGATLFIRSNAGMRANDSGRVVVEEALVMEQRAERMQDRPAAQERHAGRQRAADLESLAADPACGAGVVGIAARLSRNRAGNDRRHAAARNCIRRD